MSMLQIYTADELSRVGALKTKDDRDVYVDLSTSLLQLAKLKGIVLPTKRYDIQIHTYILNSHAHADFLMQPLKYLFVLLSFPCLG